MEDIAAIVVTHNSEAVIGPCVDSLEGRALVVVVDNASSDNTVAEARKRAWVSVIANLENLGFAGGVNQGAAAVPASYLLLLNPDTVLMDDLEPLVATCREHGIAAGCLTGQDGTPQAGFTVRALPAPSALIFECLGLNRVWRGNPVNRRYRCGRLDLAAPQAVEQPAGAFLMIRSDVFRELGGFDERFWPVWFEDVDFCRRAADNGYKPWYNPKVRALHAGGHSVRKIPATSQQVYWYDSLLKYAGKHYPSLLFRAVCLSVITGSLFRLVIGWTGRRRGYHIEEHWAVIRGATRTLLGSSVVSRPGVRVEETQTHSESHAG